MAHDSSHFEWRYNWYVTRLHAIHKNSVSAGRALCSSWVYVNDTPGMMSDWRRQRMAKNPPKCKHCLRKLGLWEEEAKDGS